MKRVILTFFALLIIRACLPPRCVASENTASQSYFLGSVEKVIEQNKIAQGEDVFFTQKINVKRTDTLQEITIDVGTEFQPLNKNQLLKAGTTVILSEQPVNDTETQVVVVDIYRAPTMYWLLGGFFLLVIVVARWQGVLSIMGMAVSLLVLTAFIIPHILAGENPILIAMIGSTVIAALSIYLSHGWSLKSHLALASMLSILLVVALLSTMSVKAAQIVGLGSEEAYFLQFGQTAKINLQGLLLAGILLGALGVLDDICVAQIAIVFELKTLKTNIPFTELYDRALNVGRDHVASLVNTLILAYAGANLPLFLLFTINQQIPTWVTLNSEVILEEVIRTLAGSIGLVLAVPLSTLIAAVVVEKLSKQALLALDHSKKPHSHTH